MKKSILFIVIIAISIIITKAQSPEKISYQAVIRNSDNELISNNSVGIQISILETMEEGTPVFVERHFPQTNHNGLVTLEIGTGTLITGNFSTINWAESIYFLKTEIDIEGGSNYTISQTTQLLSVPYALHANTASSLTEELPESDPVFVSSAASGISSANLTNWNNAYSWGNHALAGYLSSFSETDPLWVASPSFGITNTNISNWNTTFSWGNHALAGYLTSFSESDPTWNGSANLTGNITRTGKVGIGVEEPLTALHVNSNSGFLIESASLGWDGGSLGEGKRLMWIPRHAAFRAGYASATSWNEDSIGDYSMAWGQGTVASHDYSIAGGKYSKATGYASLALGSETKAIGDNTVALGRQTEAIGMYGIAMGYQSIAEGYYSFAQGSSSKATGRSAVAIGQNVIAQANNMVAFGRYNLYSGNPGAWVSTDPLFVIGNGTSTERSNALTILKNGRMGIGTNSPSAGLHIKGSNHPGSFIYLESDGEEDTGFRLYEGGLVKWHIFNESAAGGFSIRNNGYNPAIFVKQTNAYVGIGTTTPEAQLHTTGSVRFAGAGTPGNGKMLVSDADGNATWEKKMYQIGEYAQGGVVFWLDETGMHGLICAIEDASDGFTWEPYDETSNHYTGAHADGIYGGKINTAIIRAAYMGMGFILQNAATLALKYMGGNYGDWYLPSKYELNLMYHQRFTINLTAIIKGGEAFANSWYWSSSEHNHIYAWAQNFYAGAQNEKSKSSGYRVRAIRAF
jgi:hypothetical protein